MINRERGTRFWLQCGAGVLAILNVVGLYFLIAPPGGTRAALMGEREQLAAELTAARARSARLKQVAAKVQLGGDQGSVFENKYILPRRAAYQRLVSELERMTKASGLQERDATYTEEPIEGSEDLTLLTSSANYEGSYENLRKFLHELDHSQSLIMLDTLTATPQQKGTQINSSMRFQTLMKEELPSAAPVTRSVGQP